jgi:hypothetical protein
MTCERCGGLQTKFYHRVRLEKRKIDQYGDQRAGERSERIYCGPCANVIDRILESEYRAALSRGPGL